MTHHMPQVAAEILGQPWAAGYPTEETGEFVGANRRWSGQARRTGTFDEMPTVPADVVICAWMTAAGPQ